MTDPASPPTQQEPTWNPDKCTGPWDGESCPYSALAIRVLVASKPGTIQDRDKAKRQGWHRSYCEYCR